MFNPLDNKIDFPKLEEEVLSFWEKEDVFAKSIDQRPEDNQYVFYDGPPFATGLPHFGHLVPGTIKDVIPRYHSMKGKRVLRTFGWDCHGLPVEYEMEKSLGISGPGAIKEYGVAKFNDDCRSIVLRFTSQWEKTISRMGRWVDFENGYRTMDKDYMESIWWVFKTLFEKGLIYEGYNILPYSPKLGCPLSNFEVNQGGYRDVTDQAITVRFLIDGTDDTYFLAWTTTPWTLPSNLALALGPDIDYVKVKDGDEYYILGKERLSDYYKNEEEYEIVEEYKGTDLADIGYKPLFPYFADLKDTTSAFRTVVGDYVTTEDGSGIVHTASGFGEDDYQILKDTDIPVVCPIDDEAKFTSEVYDYEGRFVKDTDKDIINWLSDQGLLVKRENFLHPYPFCYRTDAPLIYRAMSSWFVDVQKIKDVMLQSNEQINWVPSHLKHGRFGKWLEGARDWAISRNRFWGNPIPIWKCDNSDHFEVIGSVAELEEKSGVKLDDLHKQFVDDLTWPSPDGKGTMRRISDVLDCWFESGSMPYAQHHYPFENKEYVDANFPADFICEGLDQTRGWFYTLTIIASGLFEKPAFLNCVTNGIVLTKDGKKMSKRDKNYTDPMEVIDEFGADALRFALMNSGVVKADDLKFSEDSVKEVIKTFLLPLYNAYSFFVTYANIDKYEPSYTPFEKLENPLDKWIISTTQGLVEDVTAALEAYDIQKASGTIVSYIDNLNNWYIRRSRRRFWRSENDNDKKVAYDTLYSVLLKVVKVAAPIVPFITESIYRNLREDSMPISVHLCDFPIYDETQRDLELEKEMSLAMKAINMGRSLRSAHNLKTRQPLSKVYLVDRSEEDMAILNKMSDIISEELNVKSVTIQGDESSLVDYTAKANFKVLGKKLGPKMKEVAALIMKLDSAEISSILDGSVKELEYSDGTISLTNSDIIVQRHEKANLKVVNEDELTLGFDTELTPDLINEGIARDIVRAIQTIRKDIGLDVSDHIVIKYSGDSTIDEVFTQFKDYIASETLCDELKKDELTSSPIELGDKSFQVEISKI